jgi:long-chain acyl-CoA synthetase
MPTTDELRAELTGPGGAFEVVRVDTPDGPMKRYKDRLPHLRSIAEIFGAAHGDKEFVVYGERRVTFAEFLAEANAVSAGLVAAGIGKGDRVAVLSANSPEWCSTFWATVDLGAILVGLNGWWNADEIRYGLDHSGAKVLVADAKRFERLAGDLRHLDALEHIYLTDADPTAFATPSDGARVHAFSELATTPAEGFPTVEIAEDDPAVIFYTSGTTGRPKGAVSTHANMIANLQNTVFTLTLGTLANPEAGSVVAGGQPVSLLTSPLFHVSGCHSTLVVGFMGGMKLVIPQGRFDPEVAFRLIEAEGVKIWTAVPTMIWRATEHPARLDHDLSSVVSVAFGGSPSADELQRRVRETFPNVKATSNAYGLTESSSAATVLSMGADLARADSVGLPMPVVDLAVAGADGEHLRPGRTGEVLIRGPIVMDGYWNDPEATAETIRDGWLHTGDVGHLDAEGYLFITDRAKDMLIRGGENVYCVEIENRLVEHPDIADAAVIGVPHTELGEEVKAVIELAPGAALSDDDIRQWVRDALAEFKVPTYVERWPEKLPRNASGKLLKNVLRGEGHVGFAELM